jgi:hypothetical protein
LYISPLVEHAPRSEMAAIKDILLPTTGSGICRRRHPLACTRVPLKWSTIVPPKNALSAPLSSCEHLFARNVGKQRLATQRPKPGYSPGAPNRIESRNDTSTVLADLDLPETARRRRCQRSTLYQGDYRF